VTLTVAEIDAILRSYELESSPLLCERIRAYVELLLHWNQKISLTAVEDPEEIVRYHFAESFLATRACDLTIGRLADVGTGAGFPGLALKIYIPALPVTLIESNARKCVFLREVVRTLDLDTVDVVTSRYDEIQGRDKVFDYVCSRALGEIPKLLSWASMMLARRGLVVLWLGRRGLNEVENAGRTWRWRSPYPIPQTDGRFILCGSVSE